MKKTILFLIISVAASLALSADVYVKNMKKTSEFLIMGNKSPEKVEIEEQWLAKDKFALMNKELTIIGDYQAKKVYFIVHKLKQYYMIPTDIDKNKLKEIVPQKIVDIITAIRPEGIKVTLEGPKKKVGNWNCQASDLEMTFIIPAVNLMPTFKFRMWMTKEIPFDYKQYIAGINEFFGNVILKLVNLDEAGRKEMENLEKVEGFQVAGDVIVSIFGTQIKAESQVMEVVEKKAPEGIYSVPTGYKLGTIGIPEK